MGGATVCSVTVKDWGTSSNLYLEAERVALMMKATGMGRNANIQSEMVTETRTRDPTNFYSNNTRTEF